MMAADTPKRYGVLHLFSGLGGAALGFQAAEVEHRGVRGQFHSLAGIDCDAEACQDFEALTQARAVQLDLFSREDYAAYHGHEPPAEWQEATARDLREATGGLAPDVVFMSPPCLPAGTPVLTADGPRAIEAIRPGEMVLTHRGRYRRVIAVNRRAFQGEMIGLRLNGTIEIHEMTAEHPVWARKVIRPKGTGHRRQLGPASFVPASTLKIGDRVGFPVETEVPGIAACFVGAMGDPALITKGGPKKRLHLAHARRIVDLRPRAADPRLWFLLGAYLGDGYRRPSRHEIIFCPGPSSGTLAEAIRTTLTDFGIAWHVDRSGGEGNIKIRAHARHLCQMCGAFGDGAHNKRIPPALINLERPFVEDLVAGYRSSDGSTEPQHWVGGELLQPSWKIPSVSLGLLRDLQRLLLRLGMFGYINHCWPGGPQVIEGRTVQTKPRYELVVRLQPKKRLTHEFIDGAVWVRIKEVRRRPAAEPVWNLEVEEDDTYCLPLMATHNCKSFSGLLPAAKAGSAKYAALNHLVPRGLRLTLEAFADDPPAIILLENVPRITTRGAGLLAEVKELLGARGYVFAEGFHDCGELGGLGQRRRRYLLIARLPAKVGVYVRQPIKRPLRTIGDVVGPMPMPDDPGCGRLHRLPRLTWRTWVRLSLIPAGGDWRDLAKSGAAWFDGAYGIVPWDRPCGTVTSGGAPSCHPACVADPRLGYKPRKGAYKLGRFDEPATAIVGAANVRGSNCMAAIADPRIPFNNVWRVTRFDEPSGAVTAGGGPSSSGVCVADPRLPEAEGRFTGKYQVVAFDQAAPCVTGTPDVQAGAVSLADPRLGCKARNGTMGVQDWARPAYTVAGTADIHAGTAAVADPRLPVAGDRPDPPPLIVALDGTWHRPLTTLELAALQGLPLQMPDGRPLTLAGNADGRWRERIGNAVPPPAAQAIAQEVLKAFLLSAASEWTLGTTPIWVRRRGEEVCRPT